MTTTAKETWLRINADGTKVITEGSAEIIHDEHVFYNPIQEFNRDMSVAAIRVWSQSHVSENYTKSSKSASQVLVPFANIDKSTVAFEATKGEKKLFLKKQGQINGLKKINYMAGVQEIDTTDDIYKPYSFTVLEALAATGLRSIRYAKEIPLIKSITTNDLSQEAVDSIKVNAKYNKVDHLINSNQGDAKTVLYKALGDNISFDVIDLDPYGSASPFLDGAVQAVSNGGLLCVTCTDLAVLAGSQPESCWAKYQGINVPGAPYTHEMAIRILLHSIQSSAAKYKRAIEPLLSCHIDYYVRVFVRIHTDATKVKLASSKTSMVYSCQSCKSFELQAIGKHIKTEKGSKFGPASVGLSSECQVCGSRVHIAGPIYSDPIHNTEFVSRMIGHVSANHKLYGTWERMAGMLVVISEELETPLYYVLSKMCNVLHCSSPALPAFVSALLSTGFKVSQSHACPQSIKTNAPSKVLWDILRHWCILHPIKSNSETSPGFKILSVAPETAVSFEIVAGSTPESSKLNLVRFQENPTANWGPQARPNKEIKKRGRNKEQKDLMDQLGVNIIGCDRAELGCDHVELVESAELLVTESNESKRKIVEDSVDESKRLKSEEVDVNHSLE